MMLHVYLVFLLIPCLGLTDSYPYSDDSDANEFPNRRLLLVLLDGFRWDYFNNITSEGGFNRFIRNGVRAEYMDPVYPSESFPGYYAVTTGLYGESNGIPLNYMYNKTNKVFFKMLPDPGSDHPFWWEVAEPLWITTTRYDYDTATFLWPGGHVPINGILPKYYTKYERVTNVSVFLHDMKRAVDLFRLSQIQYAQVYCEFPDVIGHTLGPEVFREFFLHFLDQAIEEFLDYVHDAGLEDYLNIVIVSDHGMTESDTLHVKTIELDSVIEDDDVEYVLDRGSHVGIYPAVGKKDKVYENLKKLEGVVVYKREEIPEEYHIKHSERVPPIFVKVLKGYYLIGLTHDEKQVPRDKFDWQYFGFHGYDAKEDEDMRGIFIAKGPDFKKGFEIPPINIVDPYNLLSLLLGIEPKDNNGTWANVKHALKNF